MDVVERYFAAFNAGDVPGMLACLDENVVHHVNQGDIREGRDAFAAFCDHMSECYREQLRDLVIFRNGDRYAAEFTVEGTYLKSDEGLPEAKGQTYRLPAGSFLETNSGLITRVTTYYNLQEWLRQVAG